MLPNYYYGEIPLQFNFVIIKQKALVGNLIEFMLEFKTLNSDYLCVFISMGSDMDLILNWLSNKKISPKDYFVDNELNYMDENFPEIPQWLTIFRNRDGMLCCNYLYNFFYTDLLDFKNSIEDELLN